MKQWLPYIGFVVAILAMCLVTYLIGYDKGFKAGYTPVTERTDTTFIEVPVYIDRPVPVVQWREREKLVYVPVNKDSLVYVRDTLFMPLQREYKQYSGENYTAQVSGVAPSLDWLKINQQTMVVTNTKTVRKRWGFSVTAGPGIVYGDGWHPGVGIVAGFGYNF